MIEPRQLLSLLKRIVYSQYDADIAGHICPDCRVRFEKYGHTNECELAQTIEKLGGEVKIQPKYGRDNLYR